MLRDSEIQSKHLRLSESGRVFLKHPEIEDGDEDLGTLDYCDCPDEFEHELQWIASEVEDENRFALGCREAAEAAWNNRWDTHGDW